MIATKRLMPLLVIVFSLWALALPAFAQNEFDYRGEGLSLTDLGEIIPVFKVDSSGMGLSFNGSSGELTLAGTTYCLNDDPACFNGGVDGQPFIIIITGLRGPVDPAALAYHLPEARIASLKIGDREIGALDLDVYGNLACADEACHSLAVQMAACGAGDNRTVGMVLTGSVLLGDDGRDWLKTPGEYTGQWTNLGGTAYLTRAGTPNPVCDGRDLGGLFEAEYVSVAMDALPDRGADPLAPELPEIEGGRIDRRVLIDIVSVGLLRDMEIILNVRGAFFGQCGVAPQTRIWDDTDIVHVTVYRVIPDDKTCSGGMESFEVQVPVPLTEPLAGDRFRVNINGQIIAILIG